MPKKDSDLSLTARIRDASSGEKLAIEQLFADCRPLLKLSARRHLQRRYRSRFDESDVVQLAIVEALDSFPEFRGQSTQEFLAWLQTILKRTLSRLYSHHSVKKRDVRKEKNDTAGNDFADGSGLSLVWNRLSARGPGPRTEVINGENAVLIAKALQQLPQDYRRVLELRFLDGLKLREIAVRMGVSVGSAAGLLRRALDELHSILPEATRSEIERPSS